MVLQEDEEEEEEDDDSNDRIFVSFISLRVLDKREAPHGQSS